MHCIIIVRIKTPECPLPSTQQMTPTTTTIIIITIIIIISQFSTNHISGIVGTHYLYCHCQETSDPSWAWTLGLLLELALSTPMPTSRFWVAWVQARGGLRGRNRIKSQWVWWYFEIYLLSQSAYYYLLYRLLKQLSHAFCSCIQWERQVAYAYCVLSGTRTSQYRLEL